MTCKSYIIVKSDEFQIIAGKRERERFEIASITKVMTMWVCLDILDNYLNKDSIDIFIMVSQKAAAVSTHIYIYILIY